MEADGLRWALLVIGSLVIVGLAIHGIWISRKNSEKKSGQRQKKYELEFQPSDYDDPELDNDIPSGEEFTEPNFDFKIDIDNEKSSSDSFQSIPSVDDFDDLGLGTVRVVSAEAKGTEPEKTQSDLGTRENEETLSTGDKSTVSETKNPEATQPASKIYASVVTQPKPEYAAKYQSLAAETVAISQQEKAGSNQGEATAKTAVEFPSSTNATFTGNDNYQAPEPPPFLLKKDPEKDVNLNQEPVSAVNHLASTEANVKATEHSNKAVAAEKPHTTLAEKLSLTEQARNLVKRKKSDTGRKRREPKIAEDQMRIDFDDTPEPQASENSGQTNATEEKTSSTEPQQEVLVLNVKVADGEPIPGSALLPMLLTLGFKFGDQDIFHRHVNSNGKGPVLFSLANMFKPGNFDIDNLENFTTQGISLFMILPIEGEPHQVFNMMHNAARKIADEFSGQIYDGRRALLTKQSLQQYIEKIREFERQRLLKR